jgi:hypothetical protein
MALSAHGDSRRNWLTSIFPQKTLEEWIVTDIASHRDQAFGNDLFLLVWFRSMPASLSVIGTELFPQRFSPKNSRLLLAVCLITQEFRKAEGRTADPSTTLPGISC